MNPDALGMRFSQGVKSSVVVAKDRDGNEIQSQVAHGNNRDVKSMESKGLLKKLVEKSGQGRPALGEMATAPLRGPGAGVAGDMAGDSGEGDFGPVGAQEQILRRLKQPSHREASHGPVAQVAPRGASVGRTPRQGLRRGGTSPRPQVGDVRLKHGTKTPRRLMTNAEGGLEPGDKIVMNSRYWVVVDLTPTSVLMVSLTGVRHWEFRHKMKYDLVSKGNSFDNLVL